MTAQKTPDAFLVERALRGDSSAMDTLFNRHEKRIYHYACRLTGDPDTAADVMANGFIRVFKSLSTFKYQSTFATWMHRIVTNCYFDMKRREGRRPVTSFDALSCEDGEPSHLDVPDAAPSAFQNALTSERNRAVAEAMIGMSADQKLILSSFYLEMLSYEEIAMSLDCPLGTVKSRLNRARRSLSEAMAENKTLFDDCIHSSAAA